jgi:hypothetical protein
MRCTCSATITPLRSGRLTGLLRSLRGRHHSPSFGVRDARPAIVDVTVSTEVWSGGLAGPVSYRPVRFGAGKHQTVDLGRTGPAQHPGRHLQRGAGRADVVHQQHAAPGHRTRMPGVDFECLTQVAPALLSRERVLIGVIAATQQGRAQGAGTASPCSRPRWRTALPISQAWLYPRSARRRALKGTGINSCASASKVRTSGRSSMRSAMVRAHAGSPLNFRRATRASHG